jgi:hypothetical protein
MIAEPSSYIAPVDGAALSRLHLNTPDPLFRAQRAL